MTTPETHSTALAKLITALRPYFSPNAAEEVLIELRAQLCRFDSDVFPTQAVLCHFLPSYLHYW